MQSTIVRENLIVLTRLGQILTSLDYFVDILTDISQWHFNLNKICSD